MSGHPWIVATNDESALLGEALAEAERAGLRPATFDHHAREAVACA